MPRFNPVLAAVFAPVAFAIPQAPGYGGYGGYGQHPYHGPHRPSGVPTGGPVPIPSGGPVPSGSGLSPVGTSSAPYGLGNSTGIGGPTGTGTGSLPLHTVTVIPLPVTSGGSSGLGNSPTGLSSAGGQCGPATVTVTSANTVTVTVPAGPVSSPQGSSPVSGSPVQSAPYPTGNGTSVIGSTGIIGTGFPVPTGPGIPVLSDLPSSSGASSLRGNTAAPVGGSSASGHGYHHISLHRSRSSSAPVVSSSGAPVQSSPAAPVQSSPAAPVQSSSAVAPVVPSTTTTPTSIPGGVSSTQPASSTSITAAAPATSASAPVYSSTSSTSVTTPTSSPSTSGGDVVARGLVYNTASLTSLFQGPNIGWCYNWDSATDGTIPSSMNYVPMLWSTSDLHLPQWQDNVNTAIANGATHILAFNEPDLSAQANMSPQEAVDAWSNMEAFGGKVKIGSPAVCNGGGATGLNWLTDFIGRCSSCQIDFIAIHWYGLATDDGVADLKNHIGKTQSMAGGRPIWLTEFQPSGSVEEQQNFMSQMLPWLDDKSNGVERYAYYEVDGILASGSSLTTLGDAYVA